MTELLLEVNATLPIEGYGDSDIQDILPNEDATLPNRHESLHNILSRCTNLTQLRLVMDGGEKKGKVRQAYHDFLERFHRGSTYDALG